MKTKILALLFTLITPFLLNAQNLRIEVDELSKDLNKHKIVDVRAKEIFEVSHIENAINFPASLSYDNLSNNGKVVNPDKMQAIAQNLGLNINDSIVVYDDGTFFDAARVFWTLEVYGFKNVKLLNAGFDRWEFLKLKTSNETIKIKKSNYIASVNNKRLSTKFTTQIATRNPNQVIIDARPENAYLGKESSAKRFGHIPKAVHIPAVHNLSEEDKIKKLKDTSELKDLYKDIDKDKKIVIYCAIGKIASTNYFALRELGYNVSNYDASWKEWGNDFSLPIINKSQNLFKKN